MTTKELGQLGEKLACEYLVKKGYKILGKNYRINFGEIDIIAKKKWRLFIEKTIHFVEVKALVDNGYNIAPEEHVDARKKRKLRQMAQIWLQKNRYKQAYPHQIDVMGILVNEKTKNAKLHYFGNVVEDL